MNRTAQSHQPLWHTVALFFGTAIVALASGCTVGPDYKQSTTPIAPAWMGTDPAIRGTRGTVSVVTTEAATISRWWEQFNDPALTTLVQRAADENLDVAAAQARVREARATRDAASAGLAPQVNTTGFATRSRSKQGGTGNLFRAGFDSAWEIDVFGGIRRGVEAADAQTRSAVEDARDVRVTVIGEVATTYCELRGAQRSLEFALKNLETQRNSLDVTSQRYGAGFVGGLDVANARAQVASTESRIPAIESQIRALTYALGVLVGREPGELTTELAAHADIPTPPATVPVGLPSDLLRRRPDIRRAEENIHAATARVGVATADLYPKFSISGSLGAQSGNIEGLGSLANRYWSFGPSVNWPLLDGGRIRANIRLQEALADETGIAYKRTVLLALQDVETSLVSFGKEQERRASLVESVDANRKAVELANILYTAGKTDFLNVLNVQRSLLDAEDQLVKSTTLISTNLVAVYKAIGGGWEEDLPQRR